MHTYFVRLLTSKLFLFPLFLSLLVFSPPAIAVDNAVMAPLVERSMLLDIARAGDNLVAVGERGHILISDNNGGSWEQIAAPTRATLTSVFFLDKQTGWIVGHDQVILRTTDAGNSWQQVYENIDADAPLLDIIFLDQNHGYAIGAYGQFLESFDGGSSWEGRWISEDDFHLNELIAVGDKLFIAAEAGYAYRSADGGKTWTTLSPDYMGSFFGILATADDSLLLLGLRGNLFRSADNGNNWELIETGVEASLSSGLVLPDGSLLVAGLAGTLLLSSDDGRNVELQQDPSRKGFSALTQAADGTIVGVGDFGVTKIVAQAGDTNGN